MEIKRADIDGRVEISLAGRLDANTCAEADAEFKKSVEGGTTKFLVDLAELEYISSAGLRILLVAAKQIRQKNGKIILCSLGGNVKEVFEISGFTSIFNITGTLDEARKALN